MITPTAEWGPALLEHRKDAARVHKTHGTTMGGVVESSGASDEYAKYMPCEEGVSVPPPQETIALQGFKGNAV